MILRTAIKLALSVGMLSVPLVASAAWTGKGEAGLAASTSNAGAKNNTVTAKFDLADEIENWTHAFGASTLYTSSKSEATTAAPDPQDETTANRWELHEQSDYKFSARAFWFENIRHEHDQIGSFEYQSALSTGLGYKLIDSDSTKLSTQLGVGYKKFKERNLASDSNAIVTGLVDLKQVLTSNTTLLDKLAFESGSSNTLIQNDLALQVKMTDVMALAVGYQVRYNTKPGSRLIGATSYDYAHSDRLLTVSLVYEFK
jgi:putative salt-induced outer membrane protein